LSSISFAVLSPLRKICISGGPRNGLNMTQPPLSRQIQLLEHDLGVTLFDRTSRSVYLTQAGRTFLPEARQMLRLAEGAAVSARRVAQGSAAVHHTGVHRRVQLRFLPRLVALAMADMPDVDLDLREMTSARQMEALAAGRLDAGMVRLPVDRRGNELACVLREPLVLAAPAGHPLASGAAPGLRDLDRVPFIMYATDSPTKGRYFHDLTSSLFRAAEIAPRFVQHVSRCMRSWLWSARAWVFRWSLNRRGACSPGGCVTRVAAGTAHAGGTAPDLAAGHDNPALRMFRETVVPKLF